MPAALTQTKPHHTPGPFEAPGMDGDASYVICTHRSRGKRRTVAHAYSAGDAALFAAAPSMLATLEAVADVIRSCDGGDPRQPTGWKSDELLAAWLSIRATIAQATNRPSKSEAA